MDRESLLSSAGNELPASETRRLCQKASNQRPRAKSGTFEAARGDKAIDAAAQWASSHGVVTRLINPIARTFRGSSGPPGRRGSISNSSRYLRNVLAGRSSVFSMMLASARTISVGEVSSGRLR